MSDSVDPRARLHALFEGEEGGYDPFLNNLCGLLGIKTEMGREALAVMLSNAMLLDAKQQDYGSGNIATFGERGVLVRAVDKTERLKTLIWRNPDNTPKNEAVADTWSDFANYGVIGQLCRAGLWH